MSQPNLDLTDKVAIITGAIFVIDGGQLVGYRRQVTL